MWKLLEELSKNSNVCIRITTVRDVDDCSKSRSYDPDYYYNSVGKKIKRLSVVEEFLKNLKKNKK